MNVRNALAALLLCAGLTVHPQAARAAQSYDNCKGVITSLPATISTQGVWCLTGDLSTAITTGNAITIAANNVTIDCNDFKIGGLAAGNNSTAMGVYAGNQQNVTIRNCNIRGFNFGIHLVGGAGHLVEANRLDNNLYKGIDIAFAEQSVVRRNRVFNTGGYVGGTTAFGIIAYGDVIDNIVDGIYTDGITEKITGIYVNGTATRALDNRVSGLALNNGGTAYGIDAWGNYQILTRNSIVAATVNTIGFGIHGNSEAGPFCRDNIIANFTDAISNCSDDGGNALH